MKQLIEEWQVKRSKRWFEHHLNRLTENYPQRIKSLLTNYQPKSIEEEELDLSLFYTGKSRTGKTTQIHFRCLDWHYNYFCLRRGDPRFKIIKVPELFERLRNLMNKPEEKQEFIADLKTVPLLVLDDIGAHKMTDWVTEILYLIVDHRYDEMYTTYYTSNLTLEELSNLTEDDRLVGRIANDCKNNIITFNNEPYV